MQYLSVAEVAKKWNIPEIMLLVALLLVFSGCAKKDDSQYATVGFDAIIADNPIDKKYGNIEFNGSYTEYCAEVEEYIKCWKFEMDRAIQKLLPLLKEEDRTAFEDSQESWEEYYSQNFNFQQGLYTEFDYEILGHDYWLYVFSEKAEKIKDRTLDIIEHICALGGEYSFEFSQSYVSAKTEAVEYDIQEFKEADGNVVIRYPSLTGKEYAVLNEIIYNEALYILKYYGEAYPKTFSSDVLEVFRDDKYLSIVYVGRGQLDDDSPINYYKYTTILDITEEKKVRLTDIACVDDDFIRNFRDSAKAQLPSELYDGLINWKSEELYEYLMSADRLDLAIDEQRDVFSYIDANGLNIVFPLPRAAGDYCTVTMWGDINYENKQ